MTEEPAFTIDVVVAGRVVSVATSAATARRNVTEPFGRPHSALFGRDPSKLDDRANLHQALSTLAADVLLAGTQSLRTMQDADGRWWTSRGELVGAVAVVDESADQRRSVGFTFAPPE